MKKEAVEKLRQQTDKELQRTLQQEEKELAKLRIESAMNKVEDTHAVYKKRKKIAVIKTLLTERKDK
jgi:ribosomal protein L29